MDMDCVCCCFHGPDVEENVGSNGSNNGNCTWPSSFIQCLMNKYEALFGKGEMHAIPSSIQGSVSSNSTVAPDNMPSGTQNNPNSQNSQLQQDGIVMRHGNVQISPKFLSGGDKHNGSYCEGGSQKCYSESSVSSKVESGVGNVYPSSEDEDVCPTCLEEYTPENPKIITRCSHHYHLSCIYEWMERSQNCPICGKVMAFDETT